MTAGTDAALRLLLDPAPSQGSGFTVLRRHNHANGTTASYYIEGNVAGVGKAMWVDLTISDDDAAHDAAIRTAFGV